MIETPENIRKSESHLTDVTPQAIFWRPIRYFSYKTQCDTDQLDSFEYASYTIGNCISFDLRHYLGHPPKTTTLYFSIQVTEIAEILNMVEVIRRAMEIPLRAIAWVRGDNFTYGHLSRKTDDRLIEKEARLLCLKIAAAAADHEASTNFIKNKFLDYYQPSESDLVPSNSRLRENLWQQIVGNVRVHFNTQAGPFALGYAERIKGGMRVTSKGLDYLNSIGFSI